MIGTNRTRAAARWIGALALCVSGSAWAQLTVSDAWVRATVEGQDSSGAYMVIRSAGDATLTGVRADVAQRAALHEMMMHGDMMMMMPLDFLPVKAGKPLVLDEHGYHIMLEGLKKPIHAGDDVTLTLLYKDAGGAARQVAVHAKARALDAHGSGAAMSGDMGHMHGDMDHH